jgi:SAM-dependent methyltransferase
MLNWSLRYAPLVRELRRLAPGRVLDVGSGPEGLRMFWRGDVVGAELAYKRRPLHRAVIAHAARLPFPARAFPAVVSSDLLEHLPPGSRPAAIAEMSRLAARALLLTFPSGAAAARMYRAIARFYRQPPPWLADHLAHELPDAAAAARLLENAGWDVTLAWYESPRLHQTLVLLEDRCGLRWGTYPLLRVLGPWLLPRPKPRPPHDAVRAVISARRY